MLGARHAQLIPYLKNVAQLLLPQQKQPKVSIMGNYLKSNH